MSRSAHSPGTPRVLLLHGETLFCAGAQKMLAYFLQDLTHSEVDVTLAMAPSECLRKMLPPGLRTLTLPANQKFSLPGLLRQAFAVRRLVREHGFDVLHGWTARDWELTSFGAALSRRPSIGLLHDHPVAPHISRSRQRMMRGCARRMLSRVVCVSQAVADACARQGYPPDRLVVVRNGIPMPTPPTPPAPGPVVRLGFLGVFSERKGLRLLFEVIRQLAESRPDGWELHLAGGTQEPSGVQLMRELEETYRGAPWWSRLHWRGWISDPAAFLASIDLLVVPSSEFDPFPTVLLEAGSATRAVLAADVGGVSEIVEQGRTGWCFDPARPADAAARLAALLDDRAPLVQAATAAASRVRERFSVDSMAMGYARVYRDLCPAPRANR